MIWLITGVSRGLGRDLALAALARGDIVAGTVRTQAAAAAFAALHPTNAIALVADVTDASSIEAAVAHVEARHGRIDVLVNNAGFGMVGAIEETSLAQIRDLFETNVFGAIGVIQAVLPGMRARRAGHIVTITSVSGWAPWAGTAIYGASKFAMECIGRTLAQELEPLGIKVSNVAPGGLRTDFAGTSLRVAAHRIDDYATTAHQAERIFADHAGEEPGDPAKAAQAILALVDADTPPLRLLLGADALGYAESEIAAMQADIAAWRPLTLSIAVAGAVTGADPAG
ncbi:oxidoreductase [Sphingomonas faeni]|uniref:oxidoreductase n=1 Tax=Sphingomonas faeni TaxID=185950 RepID=UPI0020C82B9B|nr:oxidoreductase [Sphingomonas faeni]MCP8890089.1 oxidoreductase [Sphingomonas faeni]